MVRTANVLVAILSCATASTALACFAPPDAKPTSELSELQLADRSPDPVVIYTVGNYQIHVQPQDLLGAIRPAISSRWPDDTLGSRIESLLPLTADIDIREILTAIAPEKPAPGERTQRAADYHRFWRQADQRLRYDLSELLEGKLATVIEKSSGAALNSVVRNKYSEVCHGGRKFMAPNGAIILETTDWIS
jgi:hypothetical protein